jgi:hypothetical protein
MIGIFEIIIIIILCCGCFVLYAICHQFCECFDSSNREHSFDTTDELQISSPIQSSFVEI